MLLQILCTIDYGCFSDFNLSPYMISICLELSIVCSAGHFTDYKIISNVKTPMYAYFWVRITRTRPAILVLTGSLGVSLEAGVWSREFFTFLRQVVTLIIKIWQFKPIGQFLVTYPKFGLAQKNLSSTDMAPLTHKMDVPLYSLFVV